MEPVRVAHIIYEEDVEEVRVIIARETFPLIRKFIEDGLRAAFPGVVLNFTQGELCVIRC